jgi:hypothetical protein
MGVNVEGMNQHIYTQNYKKQRMKQEQVYKEANNEIEQ